MGIELFGRKENTWPLNHLETVQEKGKNPPHVCWPVNVVVAPVTQLLAVQRLPQVHHGDFSVAIYRRDSREQAGFRKSTKRYSEELKTPLEC